ncbi:hypothetical protein GCM10011499_04330 [Pelagibacterium lentulum]|uniref:Uncharacterized protein n=1 Tax=Pelagibacterium lentulum TaxID=2029865 RepID=A0A916R6I9_9HYPH|nr:hypothetical protein GCM10011499_04330 [Pelagibacterium lentulum]
MTFIAYSTPGETASGTACHRFAGGPGRTPGADPAPALHKRQGPSLSQGPYQARKVVDYPEPAVTTFLQQQVRGP